MSERDPDVINRLIGEFIDLHEAWERGPDTFDWGRLEALARRGANAYNEGAGPSFHALALDGVDHNSFHERFLGESIRAGFDPFRLVRQGTHATEVPVIDHADLAEAALANASSARMRTMLMAIARDRFGPMVQEIRSQREQAGDLFRTVDACAESIPVELLEQIAPGLAPRHGAGRLQRVDPVEGYLSPAEVAVENIQRPYG